MTHRDDKKIKSDYIDKLYNLYKSKEYHEFIQDNDEYNAHIEEKKTYGFWSIQFFDVVDNKKMNNMMKRIGKLKKDLYKLDMSMRSPKFRRLNYFNLAYDYKSSSRVGNIHLLQDKYIRSISIDFTQINNNEAMINFNIGFNNIISVDEICDLIMHYKKQYIDAKFATYYFIDSVIENNELHQVYYMLIKTFKSVMQAVLLDVLSLGYGENYILPSVTIINYPESLYSEKDFKSLLFRPMITYKEENQYIVVEYDSYQGVEFDLYFYGNTYKPIYFTRLIYELRMDFYFYLFDEIERRELNSRMNKYFGSTSKRIKQKDYKWIINKLRAIEDNSYQMTQSQMQNEEISNWKQYYEGDEVELDFVKISYSNKYYTIYQKCSDYIQTLYNLQRENLIITIATLTFIVSIVGMVVTICK